MDSRPFKTLITASGADSALNNRRGAECEVITQQLGKSFYLAPTYKVIQYIEKVTCPHLTAGKLHRKFLVIYVRGVLRKAAPKASGLLPVIFGAL